MTLGFAALLANQERVRIAILAAEGIEARKRRGARRTKLSEYNAFGWAASKQSKREPKPFNTRDGEPRR